MRRILHSFLLFTAIIMLGVIARAQERTVSGTILAEDDNTPLQGVTVTNRNTNKRVQTNAAGYYTIAAAKGQVLIITFVGYVRRDITVDDQQMISLKLTPSDQQIGEVVVTAYGIKREKKSLGVDVQEVKGEDIAATRRDNFINSLAGRVPGASVVSTSGAPGSSTSIILRGGTSIGLTNQPLFVIDGVPLDNNVVNQDKDGLQTRSAANRSDDFTNRAADINPEDIETVTILKGPEAQALYGSDGANGAIVITTKKGKSGKAAVTYDNSFRFENLYRYHETQRVYSRGRNGIANPIEGNAAFGEGGVLSPFFFGPKFAAGTTFYDNLNNFFRTGFTQQHNISVEGGNEGLTYRFNTGYTDQDGVIPSSGYNRLSIRFSANSKISPKSNLLVTTNFVSSKVDKTTKGLGGYYMTTLTWPGDNDMSSYLNPNNTRKLLLGTSNSLEYDNPYWDVNKNESKDRTNRIMGNVTYTYNPSKVIGFTTIVSIDNYTTQGFQVTNPTSRYGVTTNGYFSQYDLIFRQLTGNFRASIKKNFKNLRNALTLGFYAQDDRRVINSFKGERFFEPDIASINNTEPITRVPINSIQEKRIIRFYGQYQLNWKDILIPTFSGAYEGTSVLMSRFVEKDPFYAYGSGSLAFNISEIPAFKDKHRKIDLLKLRASYSTSGQTAGLLPYNIDPTFQAVTTTGGGYAYGFTGNNFDLKPQFTKSFEYGLEGSFFKKRLGINLSIYNNKTTDQIFVPRVSYGAGFILKFFNGGDVQNKGVELQLTGTPVKTKNVTWDITFNYDHFRNKVLKINAGPGGYYESDTWVYGNLRTQTSPGKSIYSLYGTAFAKNDKGQLLISPTTGLPITTAAAPFNQLFVPVGDRAPDFSMAVINSISYKTFTLAFNLDIRKGGDIFNGTEMALYRNGLSVRTVDRENPRIIQGVLNDGLQNTANPTPNNIVIIPYFRNDFYQGVLGGASGQGFVEADFIEKDIKWLRMRDMTLSYKLHADVVKRFRIKSASFFITATDLFMITNYSGADPSVNTNNSSAGGIGGMGIDYGSISTPRAINTGIRISF